MGLAQSLLCSKCSGNNAFYRHHYLQSDENSQHHQKQNGPCLPSSGKRKAKRGGCGGLGEEGKGLRPKAEHPAPMCVGTSRQGGPALLSNTQMERAREDWVQHG